MDSSEPSTFHLGFRSSSKSGLSLDDTRWNLLTFLCFAQTLSVDLLPITWHSALEQAGFGATATLRERLINSSLSLLFKQIHPRQFPQHTRGVAVKAAFLALSTELWISRHYDVVKSNYLINLEGVSWDVEDDRSVWPVLVYEKATHGSIKTLIDTSSHQGQLGLSLSFSDKLRLCSQVARGIATFHKAAIVHGDVKPDNILVFGSSPQDLTAKLTDFGYSTFCLTSRDEGPLLKEVVYMKDTIKLTKRSLWSHPDRHDRGYEFQQAVLEEVYSFGMTCFWILFSTSAVFPSQAKITSMKKEGRMPELCSELAHSTKLNLSMEQVAFTERLFAITLSNDAQERCTFQDLVRLFEAYPAKLYVIAAQSFETSIPTDSALIIPEFSLIKSLAQLLTVDYRVRAHIRDCLLQALEEETNEEALRRTHYEIACCYHLGFGGSANQKSRDLHLLQAGLSLGTVEAQLLEFNSTNGVVYFKGQFHTAMESGLIPPLDMVQALRDVPTSSNLAVLMQEEIESMRTALGPTNTHIVHMVSVLANLYYEHGQIKPAHDMLLTSLNALENDVSNIDPWDLLFLRGQVAEANTRAGNWEEATPLLRTLLEEVIALGGELHAEVIVIKNQLALTLADLGSWAEAVRIQKEIVETQIERLGEKHPVTLQFQASLLQSLIELGDYDAAEELMRHIARLRISVWGEASQDTLLSMMDEARLLEVQSGYEEAEALERSALKICQQSLEQDHPYTLDCMMNLALTLIHRGGLTEGVGLAEQCVTTYSRVKGEQHPDTLRSRSSLALVYKESGKWKEAAQQDSRAYEGLQQGLGTNHPITLESMYGLGQDYWKLNMLEQAEQILIQCLEGRIAVLGDEHTETLETMNMLGNIYAEREKLDEATAILDQTLRASMRRLGENHRDTLIRAMNLATVYGDAGHAKKAMELEEETLAKAEKHCDPHDSILVTLNRHLAMSCMSSSVERYDDGLRLAENALNMLSTFESLEGDGEALADAQSTLAQVYTHWERFEEARKLHELAYASKLEMFGPDHPDTQMTVEWLKELEEKLA